MMDLVARRLRNQRLTGEPCASAAEVVGWMLAVQSQDYRGASWAVGQRATSATESEIDRLFDAGAILRTHILRPTWHFVLPDDIRWLLQLSGPRVRAGLAGRFRRLELDEATISRSKAILEEALDGGKSRTRTELGTLFRTGGIVTEGQRLPHLLMAAELDGLIISGPRLGRQHTYALLVERAPNARRLDREQALVEIVTRYFRSHGPAQLPDFVWWSGLTAADARKGIALAGAAIVRVVIDRKEYWTGAETDLSFDTDGPAHLLPNFDEYTVGYRDRSALIDPARPFDPALFSFGSLLSNVVTLEGRVRGAWRRKDGARQTAVEVALLESLGESEWRRLTIAADRMGRHIGRPVELASVPAE